MLQRRTLRIIWIFIVAWGWQNVRAQAQLPHPRLFSISPNGGTAGSVIELTMTSGEDLDEVGSLEFTHPGISAKPAPIPADGKPAAGHKTFLVHIDRSVPPGVYEVACCGLWGCSNPRQFVVGTLTEVLDGGRCQTPQTAATLALGTIVNGQIGQTGEVDWYRVTAQQGDRLILDCQAERIDSRLNPVLSLFDASGQRRLKTLGNVQGEDPVLIFDVPESGDYLVRLHDLTYRGGQEFVYRLECHTRPVIECAEPNVLTAGSTMPVTLLGYNLPGGKRTGEFVAGAELESLSVEITAPADSRDLSAQQRVGPSALGTDFFYYRFRQAGVISNPVRLGLSRAPVKMESEPNDLPQQSEWLTLPAEISGRFADAGDQDSFRFQGDAGQRIAIEVTAERQGSHADAVLRLERLVPGDNQPPVEIATSDDVQTSLNRNFFETESADPVLVTTLPETGTYRLTLQDRYREARGDRSLQYRVCLRPAQPDFRLVALAGAPSGGQITPLTLRRNEQVPVSIYLFRIDGFDQAVSVRPVGLPEHVQCPGTVIGEHASFATLMISAQAHAAAGHVPLEFEATVLDDQAQESITPENAAAAAGNTVSENNSPPGLPKGPETEPGTSPRARIATVIRGVQGVHPAVCRQSQAMVLNVLDEEAPFAVQAGTMHLKTHPGETLKIPLHFERTADAPNPIKLQVQDLKEQVTVDGAALTVPAGGSEHELALQIKKDMKPGHYAFWIQAESEVTYRRNPQAAERRKEQLAAATRAAEEFREKAQGASREKEEATRKLGLEHRKVQQAQANVVSVQGQVETTRVTVDKLAARLQESADLLETAEQQLTAQNQRLAVAQASLAQLDETLGQKEAALRLAKREVADTRALLESAPQIALVDGDPDVLPPAPPVPVESPREVAKARLERAEAALGPVQASRDEAARLQAAERPEFEKVKAEQAAVMKQHDGIFQANEALRLELTTQSQALAQLEMNLKVAQQVFLAAQEDALIAERTRQIREQADKAAWERANAREAVRREAEIAANEAIHAAEPHTTQYVTGSPILFLTVQAIPTQVTARPDSSAPDHSQPTETP